MTHIQPHITAHFCTSFMRFRENVAQPLLQLFFILRRSDFLIDDCYFKVISEKHDW